MMVGNANGRIQGVSMRVSTAKFFSLCYVWNFFHNKILGKASLILEKVKLCFSPWFTNNSGYWVLSASLQAS